MIPTPQGNYLGGHIPPLPSWAGPTTQVPITDGQGFTLAMYDPRMGHPTQGQYNPHSPVIPHPPIASSSRLPAPSNVNPFGHPSPHNSIPSPPGGYGSNVYAQQTSPSPSGYHATFGGHNVQPPLRHESGPPVAGPSNYASSSSAGHGPYGYTSPYQYNTVRPFKYLFTHLTL